MLGYRSQMTGIYLNIFHEDRPSNTPQSVQGIHYLMVLWQTVTTVKRCLGKLKKISKL